MVLRLYLLLDILSNRIANFLHIHRKVLYRLVYHFLFHNCLSRRILEVKFEVGPDYIADMYIANFLHKLLQRIARFDI